MLPNLLIRPVTHADLPTLEWDGEFTHFRRMFDEVYERARQGLAVMWIAELADVGLVGQVFVSLKSERQELANGVTRAYVYGFRVKPAYRNLGVGTKIMALVEADLIARGYQCVTLNVGQDNPSARRLYERLGYQVAGPDPGRWSYVNDKGQRVNVHEPAWRMEKVLNGA